MYCTITQLTRAVASTLGLTPEQVDSSESFEQAVYDMAKTSSKELLSKDFTGHARYELSCNYPSGKQTITITYDDHETNVEEVAAFYDRLFPTLEVLYTYGLRKSILFLAEPFIETVLPVMKLWRNKPSSINENCIQRVLQENMLLSTSIDPGLGKAVFISGIDPALGQWESALRLNYNNNRWEFKLPKEVKMNEFKFLVGAFDQGEKVKTAELTWAAGENNFFIILPEKHTPQHAPLPIGVRC